MRRTRPELRSILFAVPASRNARLAAPLLVAALLGGGAGCAPQVSVGRPTRTPRRAVVMSEADHARCVRGAPGRASPYRDDLPGAETDPTRAAYLEALSPEARRAAVAAGVEPLLASLLHERALSGGEPTLAILAKRQALEARLGSLGSQLLTVEFEAECTIARIQTTLGELDEDERARQLGLAVASLIVGAGTATAAGIWDLTGQSARGPAILGIAGGSASTVIGAATFVPRPRSVVFVHEHNLLRPIVEGEDPERLYPTFVFRLLTLPTVDGSPTPREVLLAEWRATIAHAVPEDERERAEAVLFGVGGVYDPELLAVRQRLFESLESGADALARDIDRLLSASHALLDAPSPAEGGAARD